MKLKIIAAAAAAMLLAACQTIPAGGVASSTQADEKASVAAEGAVQGAGIVAEAGVDTRVISGNRAAVLEDVFTRAQSGLGAVRAADTLGQSSTVEGQSLAALAVVVQAKSVLAPSVTQPPADATQPGDTSIGILTALATAAPGVSAVIADVGAALNSDDESFIRDKLAQLRAANDELLARLIPKLREAR